MLTCRICEGEAEQLSVFDTATSVLRCRVCRVEQLHPLPDAAELERTYSNYGTTQTASPDLALLVALWTRALERYLLRAGYSKARWSTLSFLDAGCGNGASVIAAAEMGLGTVHGIDLDGPAMERLSELLARKNLRATCERGDLSVVATRAERFDVLKLSQVIEHVQDPLHVLARARGALRPRGMLIVDCPNNEAAFWKIKNALRRRYRRTAFYNSLELGEHLWGFTRLGLRHALERSGFEGVRCRDYWIRDLCHQPENALWYPTPLGGLRRTLEQRDRYHLLKSAIPVFDRIAHTVGRGMGLVATGRKAA